MPHVVKVKITAEFPIDDNGLVSVGEAGDSNAELAEHMRAKGYENVDLDARVMQVKARVVKGPGADRQQLSSLAGGGD